MATNFSHVLSNTVRPEWTLRVVQPEVGTAANRAALAELDEGQLVAACLAGQREAFDLIVERHRRSVYLLCYRFVGNHEDASDLSQDVFVRAYKGLQRFRGQSSLGTWIYRIGVNVCLNRVSVKKPITEPIDARPHLDQRAMDPAEELLKGRARVAGARGHLAAPAKTACHRHPSRLS